MVSAIRSNAGRAKRTPPGQISKEDLAAGIYPEGDVRNRPDVRNWMAEMQEAREATALLPPQKVESFEQRAERCHWSDWSDQLSKRLKRRSYSDAYVLSLETRLLLKEAADAVKAEIDLWLS